MRCKFQKIENQISYDSGVTWITVSTEKGNLIETNSFDCPDDAHIERWVLVDGDYICDDKNKYKKEVYQISTDDGLTWYFTTPIVYRKGDFVGVDEVWCDLKFEGHYIIHQPVLKIDPVKIVKNDGSTTLTTGDTKYYNNGNISINGYSRDVVLTSCTIYDVVTSIGNYAFYNCQSLSSITIPDSVTSIGNAAFMGCIALLSINIPSGVTSIGDNAFLRCSSFTSVTIPDSVTSIGEYAFDWCFNLIDVTIGSGVTSIGRDAFNDGRSLTSITINAITPPTLGGQVFNASNCPIYVPAASLDAYMSASGWRTYADRITPIGSPIYSWNQAPSSDFICLSEDKYYKEYYQFSYDSGTTWENVIPEEIRIGGLIETGSSDCKIAENTLIFETIDDSQFKFNGGTVNYSIDGGITWSTLSSNTYTSTIESGKTVYWRANLSPRAGTSGIGTFSSTGKFNAKGNPLSLIYGDEVTDQSSLENMDYAFANLFSGCNKLINAENLIISASSLSTYCCLYMFANCTSLVSPPQLPNTNLASDCYNNMFYGCTSLITAPNLPATTLSFECYYRMFVGCSTLAATPNLSATTLSYGCYKEMFRDCTSLVTVSNLPATTLNYDCYYGMLRGCTSLATAPELPATTLVSGCYGFMFSGCTSLNYIKAMFTTKPTTDYTNNWVNSVASTGTFVKNSSATWNVTGNNGVPTGWTVQTALS